MKLVLVACTLFCRVAFAQVSGGTSLTLTTTGSSGVATLVGGVLNIPQYTNGGGATIAAVTTIIKGDGSGNGLGTKVSITSPATAATIAFSADNETVTLPTGTLIANTRAVNTSSPLGGGGALSADLTLTCATCLTTGAVVTPGQGGTGVANTATHTLGSSNQNWATLGTGIVKNTTTTGAISDAVSADVYGLFTSCTGSSGFFLKDGGTCAAPAGAGTVTVVGAGALASTALVTGGGTTTVQTAATTATMDSSGNISTPGTVSSGSGSGVAGGHQMLQGTASTPAANSVIIQAPTSVTTAYSMSVPSAAGTGFILNTDTSNVDAWTFVGSTGSGNVVRATSPTLVTPALGTPASGVLTNMTGLALAGTPLTTRGDILVVNSTPALARLAKGTQYQTLQGGASDTLFDAVHLDQSTAITGVLPTANIALALANQTSIHGITAGTAAGDATVAQVIAHGAKAVDFGSTATGACATVITDTATGTLSTDVILFTTNASIKAVTGYVPASTGGFSVNAYPTADTVNFEGCNWTSGTVDPGSITLNWKVIR